METDFESVSLDRDVWNSLYLRTYKAYEVARECEPVRQRLLELLNYLIKIKPLIKPAPPGALYTEYN